MKKCKKCNIEKELDNFRKSPTGILGRHANCKECEYGHKPHIKPTIEKCCVGCKQLKPIELFSFTIKSKNLRHSRCKVCKNKEMHLSRKANPEKEYLRKKKQDLKRKYGITIDDYNTMLKNQNGICLICKKPMEKPVVDHCHTTGKIRGLLCGGCNLGIGNLKDNIESLKNAILYLENSKS